MKDGPRRELECLVVAEVQYEEVVHDMAHKRELKSVQHPVYGVVIGTQQERTIG